MKRSAANVVFLALILLVSCGDRNKSTPFPKSVNTAPVIKGTIEQKVLFTGNILAQDAFDIFPRAAGKVSKKILKEGDPVKRGDPILMVERDEVGYTFKPMPVVSLVDGIVGMIGVDVGTNVGPGTSVAVVVHPGKMRVKLDIPERYLNVIFPGTEVSMTVDYLKDESFKGTISTSSPVIDQKTRTAKVEIELPNSDGKLRHGMFGRMYLVVEKHDNVLNAPSDSISWEGDKRFVYKIDGDKVRRTEVKTGIRNDIHVEILEGVSENNNLVTGNLLDLKDGELVFVQ